MPDEHGRRVRYAEDRRTAETPAVGSRVGVGPQPTEWSRPVAQTTGPQGLALLLNQHRAPKA